MRNTERLSNATAVEIREGLQNGLPIVKVLLSVLGQQVRFHRKALHVKNQVRQHARYTDDLDNESNHVSGETKAAQETSRKTRVLISILELLNASPRKPHWFVE